MPLRSHCAPTVGLKCNKCIQRQQSNSKAQDGQEKTNEVSNGHVHHYRSHKRNNLCSNTITASMSRFRKPCLTCGQLGMPGDTLCPTHKAQAAEHERTRQAIRKAGRTLYTSPAYRRMAKHIRDNATACHLCGLGAKPNDPWTADHLIAGDPNSPLAPAHRSCNSRRGNKPLNN